MDSAKAMEVFVYCLFTVTVFLSPPAKCCKVEEEGEFNYDVCSKNGPYHWGDIRPAEWYMCKNGTMQSPIKLRKKKANLVFDSSTQRSYQPSNAILRNTGHEIQLRWTGNAGYISINGTRYMLEQCHWHSPSEHTINGNRYDLELHMVHRNSDGKIAVTGFVYKIGNNEDPFLSTIENDTKFIEQNKEKEIPVGMVDPNWVTGIQNSEYFRYNGSLTVPPCHEDVLWTVFSEMKTVTSDQIKLIRSAVCNENYTNARPLQPINNRVVQFNAHIN